MVAVQSLIQDSLGQERYITSVKEHWTPGYITVPLALLGLYYIGRWVEKNLCD